MKCPIIFVLLLFTLVSVRCTRTTSKDNDNTGRTGDSDSTSNVTPSAVTMDLFIGANAFVDDPIDRMAAVGFIREYHLWQWDEGNGDANYPPYPNNKIQWSPSATGWDFDEFYKSVKAAGLEIAPCLQGAAPWLQHKGNKFPENDKPVDMPSSSTTNPQSYKARAHYLFQFAARYGAKQVNPDLLTLAANQQKVSGLKLVNYIEDWNEPDRYWEGPAAQFSPEEYAAMISADYDGHGNQLKDGTFGIKNADPTVKMAMSGLTSINTEYIDKMRAWFKNNRPDGKFPIDAINVHVYAWKNGEDWQGGGPAISPEDAKFKEQAQALTNYRNKYLANVEVWISEFGWDTNPNSVLSPPTIGPFDRQEVQAQWLLRAYLAFAAAGVDRAQMYMLRDVDPNDEQWFSSSGLVSQKGQWEPKKSWYYVYTMKNALKNMVFLGEMPSSDANILIYKFKKANSDEGTYVIWAKTSKNYTHKNYSLSLAGAAETATAIEPIAGKTAGNTTNLTISNSQVNVNVSEKPLFVKVNHME